MKSPAGTEFYLFCRTARSRAVSFSDKTVSGRAFSLFDGTARKKLLLFSIPYLPAQNQSEKIIFFDRRRKAR